MYQSILGAYKSIYWEVYALIDDQTGKRFIDALCEKAKQGVDIKIIVDAVGSFGLSSAALSSLKFAGVKILLFNRLYPDLKVRNWLRRIWHRTHCKILIVDEQEAFIGGVNIDHLSREWDDLHLKLSGRITRPLLRHFAKTYILAGGDKKEVHYLLHPKLIKGLEQFRQNIKFILHSPLKIPIQSPFRKFYTQAIGMAKESVNLLTPYYVPDFKLLEMISKAKRKGVKVNIIIPFRPDIKLMEYMAKAFYGISTRAGAAFYFLRRMNHGKAVSVDNSIGMIGSANLTPRSFFLNQEANVVFSDENMVSDLNSILNDWKDQADPLFEVGFKRQGWFKRFRGWWLTKLKDYV